MKNYERIALFIVLCGAMFALNSQESYAQNSTIPSTDSAEGLAIVFPLRIEDGLEFQRIAATPAQLLYLPGALRAAMSAPQSLPNGNPFPEAVSLDTLLIASFQRQTRSVPLDSVSIASLRSRLLTLESVSAATILSLKEFAGVNTILFNMYEIIDDQTRICVWMIRKDGEWAEYVSEAISIFKVQDAIDRAISYFLTKGLIGTHIAGTATIQSSDSVLASSEQLPVIEPWRDKKEYEDAQKAFNFAVSGTAIGISLTFVSAGVWQMYREVAYRNSAFSSASTISGIVAGTCAAVTAAFLTFTVADAVRMLKASQ